MRSRITTFLNDESGATAVEYGLIVAAIAGVLIVGAAAIGTSVNGTLSDASENFPE